MSGSQPAPPPSAEALTRLVLEVFRINGLVLSWGDEITREYGLTSSLWQVLGAACREPMTLAQIGRRMGLSRQSVRRSALVLEERGLVAFVDNPDHRRAKRVEPTAKGRLRLERVTAAWQDAAARTSRHLETDDLDNATEVLRSLGRILNPEP